MFCGVTGTMSLTEWDEEVEAQRGLLSHYYQVYRREEAAALLPNTLYEKLCVAIPKSLRIPVPGPIKSRLSETLSASLMMVGASEAFSLAVYAFTLLLMLSLVALNSLPKSSLMDMAGFSLPILAALTILFYPWLKRRSIRMGILGQSPLAILYLVISLKVSPSLENAVAFAARSVPDPIGKEFKRLIWEVQLRHELDMQSALVKYSLRVKPWAPGYSEAIYLVANSVNEPTDDLRIRSLEKAMSISLGSTKTVMEGFARGLSMPVALSNALGVMLPLLGLILAPVASVFINSSISTSLVVIYDIMLPVVLGGFVVLILSGRPGGMSKINVDQHPGVPKKGHYRIKVDHKVMDIPLMTIALAIFLSIAMVTIFQALATGGTIFSPTVTQGITASGSLSTLPLVLAIGVAAGFYLYASSAKRVEVRSDVKEMEKEFASSLFQLGNMLDQGQPLEQAFKETAEGLKGTKSAEFFNQAVYNISNFGMPLKSAVFDEKVGAIRLFPSTLVRDVMAIVVESSEESPRVAAATAMSISSYLKNIYDVQEKIEDTLSDSISSMQFQAMFLVPLVSGVVVGLSQLVTTILLKIGEQVSSLFAGGTLSGGMPGLGGSGGLFAGVPMQASFIQLVVGFYTVILLGLLGYFVGGLEHGTGDEIGIYMSTGRALVIGSLIYAIVTFLIVSIFGALGQTVFAG